MKHFKNIFEDSMWFLILRHTKLGQLEDPQTRHSLEVGSVDEEASVVRADTNQSAAGSETSSRPGLCDERLPDLCKGFCYFQEIGIRIALRKGIQYTT